MPIPPRVLKRRELARTRLFRVEELWLRFANGAERVYERLCEPLHGAVLVVPLLDDRTLVLVREYGAGLDQYALGFPKGAVAAGEERLAAAERELREETGFGARRLEFLKTLSLSPAYMGHRIDVVVAWELFEAPLPGDEPEPPEVVTWPLARAAELLAREDFSEGRSVAALYLVQDWLAGRFRR
ncbi:MAG: ADP compounds hydrolase NudE [Porticoccaceae bacterium]|nr:MAG: ADP compounds hydrolase NudE [Porticoccaceae bacterium]